LRFVRGIILCDDLPLTLGREEVVAGPGLERLKMDVQRYFANELSCLLTDPRRRGTVGEITSHYARELKIGCLKDPDLLKAIGPHLKMPTLGGPPLALGELDKLRQRTDALYFVDDRDIQASAGVLFEGLGSPVFDASDRLDWAVLHAFAASERRIPKRADTALSDLIQPAEDRRFACVEALFAAADERIDPKVVKLRGSCDVSAIFVADPINPLLEMLGAMEKAADKADGRAGLLESIMNMKEKGRSTLLLNIDHPLIGQLRAACESGRHYQALLAVAGAVIASAESYSRHLTSEDRVSAYRRQTSAYETLVDLAFRDDPGRMV
jgi:HSP90 family molecular chaperone